MILRYQYQTTGRTRKENVMTFFYGLLLGLPLGAVLLTLWCCLALSARCDVEVAR